MAAKIRTVDVIKSFVEGLTFVIGIDSVTDDGDGLQTLEVCETHHVTTGCELSIGGVDYLVKVVNVEKGSSKGSIQVSGAPAITANSFVLPAPFFRKGNAVDVNNEIANLDSDEKFPMVYLSAGFEENRDHTSDTSIPVTANMEIYLLAKSDIADWKVDDHYDNAVFPMQNLAADLVEAWENSSLIGELTTHRQIDGVHFGLRTRGSRRKETDITRESTFSDTCSGVYLNISLPLRKNCINLECSD